MNPVATYSFLPWLRQGVANTITAQDHDVTVKTRASIHVEVAIQGDPVGGGAELSQTIAQDIALYGPGDIVGIDARAIFRTDPHNWITNYESNYLAAIEFYDEDFPWRYTPAAADPSGLKLRPWLTLIVLQESEFTEAPSAAGQPLPVITVPSATVFPPADDLWAWAHVHFNQTLGATPTEIISPDMGSVLPRVQAMLAGNPDLTYSRIVSPRRLADNAGYHAFLIPTFETGRLAGLGLDPTASPSATTAAWEDYGGKSSATSIPFYYRWYFRTGSKGDFEYLVSLLKPQPVDARVGERDLDVLHPGSNLPPIDDPTLQGILKLGGALRVPDDDLTSQELAQRQKYENWDQPYPVSFQKSLAAFVNLADDYAARAAADANATSGLGSDVTGDPDPLITAPLYGCWQSLTQRLLTNRDGTPGSNTTNWVHQLNLDPRHRVAAGTGAEIVEQNAEEYMDDAWQQIGDVLAANRRIRFMQLAAEISSRLYVRHLTTLASANPERALSITVPVARRVLLNGATVKSTLLNSRITPALNSTAMRRVVRPAARLARYLPFNATITPGNLIARVNAGDVSAAAPKTAPASLPTVDKVAAAAQPAGEPQWVKDLLTAFPWLLPAFPFVIIAIALLLLLQGAVLAMLIVTGLLAYVWWQLRKWNGSSTPGQSILEASQIPASVTSLPDNPLFVISDPGSNASTPVGTTDSPTSARFKSALKDWYTLLQASQAVARRPAPLIVDQTVLTNRLVAAVNPRVALPLRAGSILSIPDWVRAQMGTDFNEVMAYPKIDKPMYEPLDALSSELFLPNLTLIPEDSITLIETNQPFIEAYMVGLNHEFARKLLWHEYPTDQRGSYFRQFWDVRSFIDGAGLSHDALKEKLYDIPEIHRWAPDSTLGSHNNRQPPGTTTEQAVLVIRGELLKKYPTAVIFAQKAVWARKSDGSIDLSQPRSLVTLDPAEEATPPPAKVRSPMFEAKVDPDIYFFGFDLTVPEAKGGPGTNPNDDPGWFFIIQERPGEPRFGLEIERTRPFTVFDELMWDDALPGATPGQYLQAASLATVPLIAPPSTDPEYVQHQDDVLVNAAPASAARWAYLLYRAPIMVAVHADELLK
jgi:hypothetical protein